MDVEIPKSPLFQNFLALKLFQKKFSTIGSFKDYGLRVSQVKGRPAVLFCNVELLIPQLY